MAEFGFAFCPGKGNQYGEQREKNGHAVEILQRERALCSVVSDTGEEMLKLIKMEKFCVHLKLIVSDFFHVNTSPQAGIFKMNSCRMLLLFILKQLGKIRFQINFNIVDYF